RCFRSRLWSMGTRASASTTFVNMPRTMKPAGELSILRCGVEGREQPVEHLIAAPRLGDLRAHPLARRVAAIPERQPIAASARLGQLAGPCREQGAAQRAELIVGVDRDVQPDRGPRHASPALSRATTAWVRPHARDGSRGRRIRNWFEANVMSPGF